MTILLVEDQLVLGDAIVQRLQRSGFAVDWVYTAAAARAVMVHAATELVLLDLGLPDGDGNDFLKELRAQGYGGPIIIITARDQVSDCIDALNLGADDYLTKPFNLGVLVARIEAVRRRYLGRSGSEQVIGRLVLHHDSNEVVTDGRTVLLTVREFTVLRVLADKANTLVKKADIESALYRSGQEIKSNTVEVYVSRLRRKLGFNTIVTAHGIGYKLQG